MMKNVATAISEKAAVDIVAGWVEVIQDKMTAAASREWLKSMLCERLRRAQIDIRNGFDVTLDVVAAADNGDEIADAALRRVYAEMTEYNIEPSATLKAYAVKAMRRGPVTRGPGRNAWFDNWRRDIGIAVLVYLGREYFGLHATRNREQRRRGEPSICSTVAAAMGRVAHVNISEKRAENIWAELRAQVESFAKRQSESPLIRLS